MMEANRGYNADPRSDDQRRRAPLKPIDLRIQLLFESGEARFNALFEAVEAAIDTIQPVADLVVRTFQARNSNVRRLRAHGPYYITGRQGAK